MKKKSYIAPMSKVTKLQPIVLHGVSGSAKGIGYGGVDTGGTKEPAARSFIYDDEEE